MSTSRVRRASATCDVRLTCDGRVSVSLATRCARGRATSYLARRVSHRARPQAPWHAAPSTAHFLATHLTALASSVLNAARSCTRSSWPSVMPTMRAVGWLVTQTAGCGCLKRTLGEVSASTSIDAVPGGILSGFRVQVIELVLDVERRRHALHDRMLRLDGVDRELRRSGRGRARRRRRSVAFSSGHCAKPYHVPGCSMTRPLPAAAKSKSALRYSGVSKNCRLTLMTATSALPISAAAWSRSSV